MDTPRCPFDVFQAGCPSRRAFDQIFSRWGLLVLARLGKEPVRFGALVRSIEGISEKMLSQTLKVLEQEGLVVRQEWDERPPRVEYSLTPGGQHLSNRVEDLLAAFYDELQVPGA